MKSFRNIISNTGILATTTILLTIAAAFAFVGVGMESQNQLNGFPPVYVGEGESISLYVIAGVTGKIPSLAGTLQSFALAIAYVFMPVVLLSMLTARMCISQRQSDNQVIA